MVIIDGKKIAADIKLEITKQVKEMVAGGQRPPHLAAVLVGHDGASETYVKNKIQACAQCGFQSTLVRFEDNVSEDELLQKIEELNHDDSIDGFIVQLPLPSHIDEAKIIEAIDYHKDVDGFHPINVGKLTLGLPCITPATPLGVFELLKRYNIETRGKKCVILGRSNIVGKPISGLMMQKDLGDATITVCHSHTQNIKEECKHADILITAVGKPGIVTADMVKDGAVVIDIGITRTEDTNTKSGYKLRGDVDFENVSKKCSFITPVPGGVGPMTICALLLNTLTVAEKRKK